MDELTRLATRYVTLETANYRIFRHCGCLTQTSVQSGGREQSREWEDWEGERAGGQTESNVTFLKLLPFVLSRHEVREALWQAFLSLRRPLRSYPAAFGGRSS